MSSFFRSRVLLLLCGATSACSNPAALVDLPLSPPAWAEGDGRVSASSLPRAVFETKPAADEWDTIRGRLGARVQFNNCRSRPADPEDDLKFTYDWTDDGKIDYFGTCRQTFRYSTPRQGLAEQARICVSDRRGHEVCKVWYIRLGRASM